MRGWRYFATYQVAKRNKQRIFTLLNQYGQPEAQRGWDWHHVVEGQDLECLFSKPMHDLLYKTEWPTVLIHAQTEHKIYNKLLHSTGPLHKWRSAGNSLLSGNARNHYIDALADYYEAAYAGDEVLQTVAREVISRLREPQPFYRPAAKRNATLFH